LIAAGTEMTTRVLIVDDHPAIRILIKAFLESESSFEVVGEAESASRALEVAAEVMPDLVTMDYQMPGGNDGAACIRDMKQRWPDVQILALTSSGPEVIRSMIEAGAYAAIDKAHMELVVPALYEVADRRAADRKPEPPIASQWDELRDVIAEMDAGAARMLAERKRDLAEGLELIAVLKAVLVALRNPRYSPEQANEAAIQLVRTVLGSDKEQMPGRPTR
jgi:DNA-binding NarL/FixJ family response regulator